MPAGSTNAVTPPLSSVYSEIENLTSDGVMFQTTSDTAPLNSNKITGSFTVHTKHQSTL